MSDFSLPKTYDFRGVEQRLYAWWEIAGLLPTRGPSKGASRSSSPCRRPTSPASCTSDTPCSSPWKT